MPLVRKHNSTALGIILDESRESYLPGDTISGRLQRIAPIVAADADVKIALVGRAKTEVSFRQHEMRETERTMITHESLYHLIDSSSHNRTLYEGPLHIPEDGDAQEWPFSFTIPTHPATSRCPAHWSFLPLDAASVESQTLPVSLEYRNEKGDAEALVEYFLEAELKIHSNSEKNREKFTSAAPFCMRNYTPDPPVVNFELARGKYPQQLTSQRLIPGMQKAELSVSQKVKKVFGTSSVPTLSCRVDVDVPRVIQLENTNYVPFRVRVVPQWDETSEVLRELPQTVRLMHLELVIKEIGEFKCNECKDVHGSYPFTSTTVHLDKDLARLEQPLEIPFVEESGQPYDVGAAARLTFGSRGIASCDQASCSTSLFPNLTTFNVKIKHRLTYVLKGEIAGEKFAIAPVHPVPLEVVVPSDPRLGEHFLDPVSLRSDSWIRPPDDDQLEAPPAFAEVECKSSPVPEKP